MNKFIEPLIIDGKNELMETIKILLYKENDCIFDYIDFGKIDIYKEPLLFAYFNSPNKKNIDINTILYGYMDYELRPVELEISSDNFGRFYIPNIGWFLTNEVSQLIRLRKCQNDKYELYVKEKRIDFSLEPIDFIKGTNIELLKYPIPLLNQCYYDVNKNLINVEIEKITQTQRKNLAKAFQLIKTYNPLQFNIINDIVKKVVIFNVDSGLRNSFATKVALGVGFFNSYQNDYNEVFFVDDIAHQTGHCIFYNLLHDISSYLKISPSTIMQSIPYGSNQLDTRDAYTLFHALYTYYTSLSCIDGCLKANAFHGLKRHEALGRMCFYIRKCYNDILLIDNPIESDEKAKEIFTEQGFYIYSEIKQTLTKMILKWSKLLKNFNMSNQPYNFTFSKFLELNPYDQNNI